VLIIPLTCTLCLYLFLRIDERSWFGRFIGRWWPLGRGPRSFDIEQGELDPEEIEYVHNIRNKSHETEIVISVGLFAGLVAINVGSIDDWLWSLSFLSPQAVGVIATAFIINIWLLRIGVLTHLLLRCMWIGIVGLGFSYPRGINRLRLSGPFQRRMYNHLAAPDTNVRLTIQMERLCSLQYAILMCSVFSMFAWIMMVFACSSLGSYMARFIIPFLYRFGFAIQNDVLLISLITLWAVFLFGLWSYLRVAAHPVIRMFRQPLIEILYFFRGTLLSQSVLAIPLVVAMPPLCLAIGLLSPVVNVDEQQAFVYADEVSTTNEIDVPYILSSVVETPVIQLQLPTITVNIWKAHIAHKCMVGSNPLSTEELDELDKWASKNFGTWVDESTPSKVVWIQERSGASLRGFIELDDLENGFHTLYVDPCNNVNFKGGVSIPFYLSLED